MEIANICKNTDIEQQIYNPLLSYVQPNKKHAKNNALIRVFCELVDAYTRGQHGGFAGRSTHCSSIDA